MEPQKNLGSLALFNFTQVPADGPVSHLPVLSKVAPQIYLIPLPLTPSPFGAGPVGFFPLALHVRPRHHSSPSVVLERISAERALEGVLPWLAGPRAQN